MRTAEDSLVGAEYRRDVRRADPSDIADRLAAGTPVVLVGPVGAGKTVTVNRVVEELARREIATVVVRGTASMAGGPLSALDGAGQLVPHLSAHDGAHASVALVDDADDLDTASTSLLREAVCRQHLVALFVVRAADTVRPPSDSGAALTGLVARGIAHRVDIEPLSERQAWDFLRPCGNAVADEVTRDAIIWWSNGSRALLDEFAALACDASREGRDPIAEVSELPGLARLADAAGAHLAALDAGHLGTLALIHHLPGIASAHASRIRPVAELDALCAAGYLHRDEAVAHALWANPLLGREAERMLGTEHVERMLMDAVVRMLAEDGGWWSPPIAAVLADKMLRGEPLAVAVPETIGRRALRDAAAQNNDHGDFALAEAYATTGLNSAPDDIGLGLELAHARVGAGETDAVPYPVGIEGDLDRARAAHMLTLWSNRGDSANARELRAELKRCRPGAEEPHLLLADAVSYFASLDWSRAQDVAQDLAARTSGRWRAAAWLVEAHARAQLGDPRGAKRALARIESLVYEVGVPGLSTADRLRFLMTGLVTHLVMGEDAPGVRDHIARECRRAVREGDDRALGTAGLAVALSAAVSGDVAGAVAGLDHARTRFSPLRKDMTAATVELWISQFLARDGATRAARHIVERVETVWPEAPPLLLHACASARAVVELMDQRLDDAARALGEALALTATRTSPMKRVRDLYRGLALGVVDDDAVVDIEGLLADTNIPLHASLADPPPRLPRGPRAADIRAVVTRTLVAAPRHVPPESTRAAVRGSEASLTRREIEIAGLIAAGLSNRDIAEKLFLSVRTVESHIYQARSKVGALSRGELGEHVGAASASR